MNGVNGKQHRWFALHIAPDSWTDGEKQRKKKNKESSTIVCLPPCCSDPVSAVRSVKLEGTRLWRCTPAPAVATCWPVLPDSLSGCSGHRFWCPERQWSVVPRPPRAPAPPGWRPGFFLSFERDPPAPHFVSPDPAEARLLIQVFIFLFSFNPVIATKSASLPTFLSTKCHKC